MRYKIGDVAKLLGITTEAVRHYEDQGIVSPKKVESSGYRYYDVWDIHILIRARAYRQYGYSLAEADELINRSSVKDIVNAHAQKEAEIEKAITWNLNLLKQIRNWQKCITDADASVGKYRIDYRSPMYRLHLQNNYELLEDNHKRELYHEWAEKVPFVFPSFLFKQGAFEKENPDFSYGYGVDEEYAEFLDIKESEDITYIPSCLCVYTTLMTRSNLVLSARSLAPAIEYMHTQGLKICGDVVSRVVLMNKKDDEYFAWNQLWMPIEETF